MHSELLGAGVSTSPSIEIIEFPAQVDISNAVRNGARLFAACRPNAGLVIADLGQTELLDSFGTRCLVVAADQALVCGVDLRIVIRSAAVLRVLELAGVGDKLPVYPTIAAALPEYLTDLAARHVIGRTRSANQ